MIVANSNIFTSRKFLPPNFYPPPTKKINPLQKCFSLCDSYEFSLFRKSKFFLLELNSKIFTPGVNFLNLTINIRVSQKKCTQCGSIICNYFQILHSLTIESSFVGIHQILRETWLSEHKFQDRNFVRLLNFWGINNLFITLQNIIRISN